MNRRTGCQVRFHLARSALSIRQRRVLGEVRQKRPVVHDLPFYATDTFTVKAPPALKTLSTSWVYAISCHHRENCRGIMQNGIYDKGRWSVHRGILGREDDTKLAATLDSRTKIPLRANVFSTRPLGDLDNDFPSEMTALKLGSCLRNEDRWQLH